MTRFPYIFFIAATLLFASPALCDTVELYSTGGVRRVEVEIASTSVERARGLMFRAGLKENHGMWFIFNNDKRKTFWMKNVRFPIDIIFIDKDFIIQKIWRSVPPCKEEPCAVYSSGTAVRYVLEVASGFCEKNGVLENQRVQYTP